jgi:hypothetical protein
MLHSFQPPEGPGGKALDARSVPANTGTQRIQRLTKPSVIGVGHQALDQPDSFLKACDFTGVCKSVEHRSTKENAIQVTDDPNSGSRDRALRLHQELRTLAMVRFGEKAPGQPVDTGIRGDRTVAQAGKEPSEAIRTRPIHSFQDAARTKSKKVRRNLGEGVDRGWVPIRGSNLAEPLGEGVRMVKVDGCEGGEPSLSGQIGPAKGVREEARMRLIKSEGCVESPTIERTRVKGIGGVRAFQSMLHGSLRCIQALMDSNFGKRNLLYENSSTVWGTGTPGTVQPFA